MNITPPPARDDISSFLKQSDDVLKGLIALPLNVDNDPDGALLDFAIQQSAELLIEEFKARGLEEDDEWNFANGASLAIEEALQFASQEHVKANDPRWKYLAEGMVRNFLAEPTLEGDELHELYRNTLGANVYDKRCKPLCDFVTEKTLEHLAKHAEKFGLDKTIQMFMCRYAAHMSHRVTGLEYSEHILDTILEQYRTQNGLAQTVILLSDTREEYRRQVTDHGADGAALLNKKYIAHALSHADEPAKDDAALLRYHKALVDCFYNQINYYPHLFKEAGYDQKRILEEAADILSRFDKEHISGRDRFDMYDTTLTMAGKIQATEVYDRLYPEWIKMVGDLARNGHLDSQTKDRLGLSAIFTEEAERTEQIASALAQHFKHISIGAPNASFSVEGISKWLYPREPDSKKIQHLAKRVLHHFTQG